MRGGKSKLRTVLQRHVVGYSRERNTSAPEAALLLLLLLGWVVYSVIWG